MKILDNIELENMNIRLRRYGDKEKTNLITISKNNFHANLPLSRKDYDFLARCVERAEKDWKEGK